MIYSMIKALFISTLLFFVISSFASSESEGTICGSPQECFTMKRQYLPQFSYKKIRNITSLPRHLNTHHHRLFVFSPRAKEWAAYDKEGYRVSGGVANGGKPGHRTPEGFYNVLDQKGPKYESHEYPKPSGGAPMPYAMHFTQDGHAIHGSKHIYDHNTSHGCIRVQTKAAKWLSTYFMKPGTQVLVLGYH